VYFLTLKTKVLMNLIIRDCRGSDEEVRITRMLDKILRRSDAIDKESLCILVGHRVRKSKQFYLINHSWIGVAPTAYASFLG